MILNLAFVQLSRPPYYDFTAVNYISSTIPLIPFQSKSPLSGGTPDGLASVLSNSVWNLEWYFHTRAIHILSPGSLLNHTCYQLAQEAEKEHGGGNDREEEPRVQKEGSSLPSNKEHSPQTTDFTCSNRYNKLVYCTQLYLRLYFSLMI